MNYCKNTASVSVKNSKQNENSGGIGGIVGSIGSKAYVKNSYNKGKISQSSGSSNVGGIIGNSYKGVCQGSVNLGEIIGATGDVGKISRDRKSVV